jgi:methyl coenzyme M reductase subunit C-like uncharacterized protein (methanogenesis marker protein 7)
MEIDVKDIPGNKIFYIGEIYFESQAITEGEGLKKLSAQ